VGSVTDAADAAASVIATNPAVVLLEPPDDREHLAAHVELVGAAGRCVIVFTSRAGIDDAYARASGAAALIPKSIHPDELPAAILDIHDAVAAALT
jgi:AmiR/NasT family two-component response regulator